MDARRFYAFASSLANSQAGPEQYRTAIGRSYYGAYHVAVTFLISAGVRPRSGPSGHSAVVHALLSSGDVDVISAGSALGDLHSERLLADYQLNDPWPENQATAQSAVRVGGQIITALDQCRLDSARNRLVEQAIKSWVLNTPGSNLVIV